LILLLLGLAIATALILNGDSSSAAWGLIPIAIGLAQLIFYSIGRRQEPGVDASEGGSSAKMASKG